MICRIAKIREIGARSRLIKRWAARPPECRTDILVMDPINIYETALAFILLAFGIIIGISIFTFERIRYCKKYHDHGIKRKLRKIFHHLCTVKKRKKSLL